MKLTTNYGLKKPENTDVVNIEDLNENADIIDKGLVPYIGVTSGSGNTYAITSGNIKNLTIGLAFSIKFNADSTGDCTLNVNSNGAKPIKKANGSTMTSLKASGIYTLRYDGVNFILQGEGASGDAAASDLLSGKTASTDAGDITGTMPNIGPGTAETVDLTTDGAEYTIAKGFHSGLRKIKAKISGLVASVIKAGAKVGGVTGTFTSDATAVASDVLSGKTAYVKGNKVTGTMLDRGTVNHSLPINGSYTIPAGKHSGSGKVTQAITTKGAQTYTPSTANQTIALGQYLSGIQTILGDSDLIPSNILSGKNIFGVTGDVVAGKKSAQGTATSASGLTAARRINSSSYPTINNDELKYKFQVGGLTFEPSIVIIETPSGSSSSYEITKYVKGWLAGYDRLAFCSSVSLHTNYGSGAFIARADYNGFYVDTTGFCLPVSYGNTQYNWIAIE